MVLASGTVPCPGGPLLHQVAAWIAYPLERVGEPKKAFFFAIPAEGTGVHFVGVEFELTCTKC